MDYNDIKTRLTRTFSSLNQRFDEDIERHVNIVEWENGRGLSITFGEQDEDALLNKIMIILYNLSSLKDHLKNCLSKNGYNPQLIEDEINKSLHLQVLIDIVNQEKHGAPLRKTRSYRNPVFRYPSQSFRPFFSKNMSSEIPTMFIDALIKDDKENIIFYLDELVETCFEKWSQIAIKYKCG